MDVSKADQLITRALDENDEWLSVVPDDYRRFSSIPIKIPFFGILIMIFGLFNFFDERSLIQSLTDLGLTYFIISFILIYLSHRAISKDKSIIDSSNRLR